jgi:hypothetical protein
MKILLTIIFCLFTLSVNAQPVAGRVIDSQTKKPIAYASILVKGSTSYGTIANSEGNFQLTLTGSNGDSITISHTAYLTKSISIGTIKTHLVVQMSERENRLREIVVTPNDPVLDTLRKAFDKISTNYPSFGTVSQGIYRETNQKLPDSTFDYFSEAIIAVYKSTYGKKDWGAIKIVEAGIIDNRTDSTQLFFYGGPFAAHKRDFVKERIEFINPKFFDQYEYDLTESTHLYEIKFKPRKRALYEGVIYLDKSKLAYIGADFRYTEAGLEQKNFAPFRSNKYTQSIYAVRYRQINKLWQLSMAVTDGTLQNATTGAKTRYTSEYFATDHDVVGTNPFKEGETAMYGDIYSTSSDKLTSDFWSKPETVSRTSQVDSAIGSLIKLRPVASSTKDTQTNAVTGKHEKTSKAVVAMRMSSSASFGILNVAVPFGNFSASLPGIFTVERTGEQSRLPVIDFDLEYFHNKNFSTTFRIGSSLTKRLHYNEYLLAGEWHRRIVGFKRPLFFESAINFSYTTAGFNLGTTNIETNFEIDQKKIKKGQTSVYLGQKRLSIAPSIQLRKKITSKISVYARVSTILFADAQNSIFFKRKGLLSSIRSANISSDLELKKDGVSVRDTPLTIPKYRPALNFGFQMGLF